MSETPSIKRVVVASNISGTVLTDYITPNYQCTKNDRNLASFFQSIAAIAKEFDDGELQLVSFGPTGSNSSSSPLLGGSNDGNLNVALFMENDIISGILYTVESDDVPQDQRTKMSKLARNIHSAFCSDHLDFYQKEEVHKELNNAFQNSEDLPPALKDRFASFVVKIPGIINSSAKAQPAPEPVHSGSAASLSSASDYDD